MIKVGLRMAKTMFILMQGKYYNIQSAMLNINTKVDKKECNICGWHGKYFNSFFNKRIGLKETVVCPKCGSFDWHRFLYSYLKDNYSKSYPYKILEVSFNKSNPVGKALPVADYVSIDIARKRAMLQMDLTKLTFDNDTFDIVVCLAVIEHIQNELDAIREIYRVLKVGGEALIYVPIGYYGDPDGTHTVEFGKRMFYGEEGHFRSYGLDFSQKLVSVGFKVNLLQYIDNGMNSRDNLLFSGVK